MSGKPFDTPARPQLRYTHLPQNSAVRRFPTMAHPGLRGARPLRALALASILTLGGLLLLLPPGRAAQKETKAKEPAKAASGDDTADVVKLIDDSLKTAWEENKITPSARCDDYEFIRR